MYCIFVCVFIAEITFSKRGDAKKALDKYNGVHLDGAKMKIQFVQGQSISERVVLPKRPLQVALSLTRIKLKGSSLSCFRTYVQFSYICTIVTATSLAARASWWELFWRISKCWSARSSTTTAAPLQMGPQSRRHTQRKEGRMGR